MPRDRVPASKPGFDKRFDLRSFGEPLSALRAVPICDEGEPLVDLREFCPSVILHPGCLPYLRETVARRVNTVQGLLPAEHTLTVGTAMRTMAMQREIRVHIAQEMTAKHPEWSKATLHRMLNRMVAPPDDISPPPHTTGAALDVGLRDGAGNDLDFVSPTEHWDGAPTYSHLLSHTARTNRLILIAAMEAAGLTNYVGEWWHWSYGDQGWALRVGARGALYGEIEIEDADDKKIPKEDSPSHK